MMNFLYGYNGYGIMPMMGFGLGFGLIGWLIMLLWWAFWIYLIVLAVRWITKQMHDSHKNDSLEILKQRYAKGEIDEKEFLEKKKHLS